MIGLGLLLCLTAAPKHVLFFLINDLGYADVGYHGGTVGSAVLTPTIDKLSAQGGRMAR